jgi:hypothetical protein
MSTLDEILNKNFSIKKEEVKTKVEKVVEEVEKKKKEKKAKKEVIKNQKTFI